MKIITYDALMNPTEMKKIVPSARNPTPAELCGYSLMFCAGLLNIANNENGRVPCVIYEIDDEEKELLDDFYCVHEVYKSCDTQYGKIFVLIDEIAHIYDKVDMDFVLEIGKAYEFWKFNNNALWSAMMDLAEFNNCYSGSNGVLH